MEAENLPSKTLLEFYRLKLREWRSRHADLEIILADIKNIVTYNRQREDEALKVLKDTSQLHDVISELQLCLYKEREHSLRLMAENDQFGIDKANDKRNIHFLLQQCGMKESQLYGPMKRSPKKKKIVSFQEVRDFNRKLEEFHESEVDILRLKIKSLNAELKEQTEHLRDEVVTLINELDVRKNQWDMEKELLTQQITCLNCRLHECQMKKLDSMQATLSKLESERVKEVELVEENDQLKKMIKQCRDLLGDDFPLNTEKLLQKDKFIITLKGKLHQKDQLIKCYEVQKNEFEQKIAAIKSELDEYKESNRAIREKWKSKEDNLIKKLDDERRRRLREGEGFRNDIKLLRSKLQSIERQIRLEKLRNKEPPGND